MYCVILVDSCHYSRKEKYKHLGGIKMPLSISEKLIENILLCEPITFRGRSKLKALGIENMITPLDFWGAPAKQGLWVPQIDVESLEHTKPINDDIVINFPENHEKERIRIRRNDLNERFEGKRDVALIALKGVVGSGKSIEMHRQIFANYHTIPFQATVSDNCSANAIIIDLERDVQHVPGPTRSYVCPDPEQPMFLFLTSALDTLIYYIWELFKKHQTALQKAGEMIDLFFYRDDAPVRRVDEFERDFIKRLSKWANNEYKDNAVNIWSSFCQDIINHLKTSPSNDDYKIRNDLSYAEEDIKFVFWMMFLLSYCSFPNEKKAIIIDNIEDYIAVLKPGEQEYKDGVPVTNLQIRQIYRCLYQVKQKIKEAFETYKAHISKSIMESVTIGMAIRRTTYTLLCPLFLGANAPLYDDIFDITGDLKIESIWQKKHATIWKDTVEKFFKPDKNVTDYVSFVNEIIMEGTRGSIGIPYPHRMMKMLSRGLRRVGHNMSTNLYNMYCDLCNEKASGKARYINIRQFKRIMMSQTYGAARGMLRQALIEYYYMGQFYRTFNENDLVGKRWRLLNIGQLGNREVGSLFDNKGNRRNLEPSARFHYNKVKYDDCAGETTRAYNSYRSLLWRVLIPISKRLDTAESACIAPEYIEESIGSLLSDMYPVEPTIDELKKLSKVLIGASASEREGDYSPYILMQLDVHGITNHCEGSEAFAQYLLALWKIAHGVPVGNKYENIDYENNTIRISEGGADFLYQWLASYSLFSSLYCYNFAPLFFINSKELIFHILQCVYNNAEIQRDFYRNEAQRFARKCGFNVNDKKLPEEFLLDVDGNKTTYDKYIRRLHLDYLSLYKNYIDQCYSQMDIEERDKYEIIGAIDRITAKYNSKDWSEQVICF